jgi:hypothetical protein
VKSRCGTFPGYHRILTTLPGFIEPIAVIADGTGSAKSRKRFVDVLDTIVSISRRRWSCGRARFAWTHRLTVEVRVCQGSLTPCRHRIEHQCSPTPFTDPTDIFGGSPSPSCRTLNRFQEAIPVITPRFPAPPRRHGIEEARRISGRNFRVPGHYSFRPDARVRLGRLSCTSAKRRCA